MKNLLFVFYFVFVQALSAKPLDVSVNAEAAILMNAETGAILFEKNAHKRYHPASITKIATAVYALKLCDNLEAVVAAHQDCIVSVTETQKKKSDYTLPAYWLEPKGTHIGIKKGEELKLKDLFYGMMLASGNDAANVIAHHTSGSVLAFIKGLNSFIKTLGCQNSNFCNPHGLHHPEHVSSAYDMALIAKEGLKDPHFRKIVKTVKYQRPKTSMQEGTTLLQGNRLLRKGPFFNPDAIGIKTGYISSALHTFVGAAEREGRTLIAVLLKSKERDDIFKDCNKLFNLAFAEQKIKKIYVPQGMQKHQLKIEGGKNLIKTFTEEEISLSFYPAEEPQVKCLLSWEGNLTIPVQKNQKVGEIQLCSLDGKVLQKAPLLAAEEVKPTLRHQMKQIQLKPMAIFFLAIFVCLVFYFTLRK